METPFLFLQGYGGLCTAVDTTCGGYAQVVIPRTVDK
jgi:hypothetical protein